jgi:serine/threonine protein kinase
LKVPVARIPSRSPVSPTTIPPELQPQRPAPRAASPRPTSQTGKATTSGAAEVAGAPARFFEKLASLLARYELGQEVAKAGPISGLEAHVRDSRAPVLVLALDLDRMDDARLPREEWLACFERICAIARKVTHPLLPRMIESGAQGTVRFAVLDHSEGASLSLVIGRGKVLGTEPVRKIIASAAVALQHLHERGVLFCNMQAHAMWLTREGHGRLIDFSMAAPIGGPLNQLLPTNIFALSPEYLWGREYGPASDQFALGALLYELLTQTRPFRGLDTDMIIAAIRDKDPLPPHTIDSRVDRLLSDVAMRALDKDPRRRFTSMAELARLLTST